MNIRSRISIPVHDGEIREAEVRVPISTRFRILKKDYEKHGLTIGCRGCEGFKKGISVNHSEECRQRMEIALGHDNDERIRREMERVAAMPTVSTEEGRVSDTVNPDSMEQDDNEVKADNHDMEVEANDEDQLLLRDCDTTYSMLRLLHRLVRKTLRMEDHFVEPFQRIQRSFLRAYSASSRTRRLFWIP